MRKILFVFVIFCAIFGARNITPEIGNVTGTASVWNKLPQEGIASWYGAEFHGKEMANGEKFNQHHLTAAHKSYPMGIKLKVTNLDNGNSVIVTVTDRGPFVLSRAIDLSRAAAKKIKIKDGLALVLIQPL